MSKKNYIDMNLDEIISEVSTIVEDLTKSEQAQANALKKSEESSEEKSKSEKEKSKKDEEKSKKEELDKSALAKDELGEESSGHDNQAPEAVPQEQSIAADQSAAPDQDPSMQQDEESLESMITDLDDSMLAQLKDAVEMEMQARQSQQQAPGAAPQEQAIQEQSAAPDMSAQQPAMDAMKSEVKDLTEKLAKSAESAKTLEKAFADLTAMVQKAVTPRPVQKAVTDINNVKYIDKGEGKLKKSEEHVSDADLMKRAHSVAGSSKELSQLDRRERATLQEFLVKKERNDKIEKILNK